MRRFTWIGVLAALSGCVGEVGSSPAGGGRTGGGGGPSPDDPDAPAPWTLTVDTGDLDPYAPAHATTWPVAGRVIASEGLGPLRVNGAVVPTGAGGTFATDVALSPGLNLVTIDASDAATPAPHGRQGHRSILAADYLPEGHINPAAAALTLTNEIVAPMAASLSGRIAGLDIAAEIMARPTLTADQCTTYPDSARHGSPTLSLLVSDAGELWLQIVIPGLDVQFHGSCSLFIFSTDIRGRMTTDVVLRTRLHAPAGATCVSGLEHDPAVVDLRGFDMDVSGGSGIFESLLISLMGEMREGDTADAMRAEFAAQADALLGSELAGITVFDESATMSLFDTPIDVSMCLTGLVTEGGTLRAYVGATAEGPGGPVTGPGAPQVTGALPASSPGKLWLDANLVSQLVYSAWRAGALRSDGDEEIDLSTLALVVPGLRGRYPAGTKARIAIDGRLPPLARAAPPEEGDMLLEIGELHLVISVAGEVLFRIGTQLRLSLELVPEGTALRPELLDVQSDVWVLEEPVVDADDETLSAAIQLQIRAAAAALLGDASIGLPEIGAALTPLDATPTPDGRYIEITLR